MLIRINGKLSKLKSTFFPANDLNNIHATFLFRQVIYLGKVNLYKVRYFIIVLHSLSANFYPFNVRVPEIVPLIISTLFQ